MSSKETKVPMDESGISSHRISTDGLGPCIAFLLIFKQMEENEVWDDKAVLIHYSHSMEKQKQYRDGVFGKLIQILEFIISETENHLPDRTFFKGNRLVVSDFRLIVVGGDRINGTWIHEALGLLNRQLNFPLRSICDNDSTCLLYHQLLDRVIIFKFVSKVLDSKTDEGDSEGDDEDKKDGDDDIPDYNDYPWVFVRYFVESKDLSLQIQWAACECTNDLAILNMNVCQNTTGVQWQFQDGNIKKFKEKCQHDQALFDRLQESIDLIPNDDPFVSSPYHPSQLKVGINGFDRIGQTVFHSAIAQDIQVVGVNDPFIHADNKLDKFRNDSAHGIFKRTVSYEDGKLVVNGQRIAIYTEREPSKIPWSQLGAEYVVESTGVLTTLGECQRHIQSGAKKVIITAQSIDAPVFVMGVNHHKYTGTETIVSSGSCATNCLAPLAQVVHEKFGIGQGFIMAVNSYKPGGDIAVERSNQDSSSECVAEQNVIVPSTGVAEAIGKVIPDLNGILACMDVRVQTPNVSFTDLTVRLKKKANYEEICAAIKEATSHSLETILAYTDDVAVPPDFIVNTHSSIFDARASISYNDKLVKLVAWYGNEYGYSHRVIHLIKYIDIVKHLTPIESVKKSKRSNKRSSKRSRV